MSDHLTDKGSLITSDLLSDNEQKVQNACKYHGYFAIRTNTIDDPFQSLIIYRERNIVESAFRQFKVLNESDRLYATGTTYKGKLFIYMLAQAIRMMMCVTASNHQPNAKVLPGDSFDKAMLQMQRLQASRPLGFCRKVCHKEM